MPVKVTKDSYAYERVSPDAIVRRQVFAGSIVPDGWFEDEDGSKPFTGGDAPPSQFAPTVANQHQLDENNNITDEHADKPSDQEQAARSRGGVLALTDEGDSSSSSSSSSSSKSGSKSGS
jgi:hypothetical protein